MNPKLGPRTSRLLSSFTLEGDARFAERLRMRCFAWSALVVIVWLGVQYFLMRGV